MTDPQRIDRYTIKARLGRGGMATVYHAYDDRFERDVAIKVLPREFLHDETFLARFSREAKTIAALEHSAIVPVYDFGEEEGQPYLVMRYMSGGSLSHKIEQGPMALGQVSAIMQRVGAALDRAHEQNIIHRDIKPGNILFDRYDEAYLSDFGIVKIAEATAQLTGSGIVGTPSYMAPEMADPGGMSPLVDVYALGVTLYQMLTGRLPYEADTPMGVLMAHMNKPIPDLREVRPDLSEEVQTVIAYALAKDPFDRYQSTGDMAAALEVVAAAAPGEVPPTVRPIAPVEEAPEHTLPLEAMPDEVDVLQTIPAEPFPDEAAPERFAEEAFDTIPERTIPEAAPERRREPAIAVPQIDVETSPQVARFDLAALLLMALGWTLGWSFGSIWSGVLYGPFVGPPVAGALGGLLLALALRRSERSLRLGHVLAIAAGWAFAWALAALFWMIPGLSSLIIPALGWTFGTAINGIVAGLVGSLLMALVLRRTELSIPWRRVPLFVLAWALGMFLLLLVKNMTSLPIYTALGNALVRDPYAKVRVFTNWVARHFTIPSYATITTIALTIGSVLGGLVGTLVGSAETIRQVFLMRRQRVGRFPARPRVPTWVWGVAEVVLLLLVMVGWLLAQSEPLRMGVLNTFRRLNPSWAHRIEYHQRAQIAQLGYSDTANNEICWLGSLDGYPRVVLLSCERAIYLDPKDGRFHDSRGVARAMMGDYEGAIKDFRIFINWAATSPAHRDLRNKRYGWINTLREGENPFRPPSVRQALRNE